MATKLPYMHQEDKRRVNIDMSEFMWTACVELPKLNVKAVHALVAEVGLLEHVTVRSKYSNKAAPPVTVLTGSISEFHIDTPLPCINDIDVMYHSNDMILIPEGGSVPAYLPADFGDFVILCEMIDSKYPGYVYAEGCYKLVVDHTDSANDTSESSTTLPRQRRYKVVELVEHSYATHTKTGPASEGSFKVIINSPDRYYVALSVKTDYVYCFRCLEWPMQAADWPKRHRSCGWPDDSVIERIVKGGCDVVEVSHRLSVDDWIQRTEQRLSFSRAETVLLNGCTKCQQIVYHVLRFVVKTERLADMRDSSGHRIISCYHIKTLLLWALELQPQSWWADHRKLFSVCVALLKTLVCWMQNGVVQHYFVKACKLSPEGSDEVNSTQNKTIVYRLQSVIDNLPEWFYHNYICRSAANIDNPDTLLALRDAKTADERHGAIRELANYRNYYLHGIKCSDHKTITSALIAAIRGDNMTIHSCAFFIRRLAKIDERLLLFFYAVFFANFPELLRTESPAASNCLDVLYTALLHYNCTNADADTYAVRSQSIKFWFIQEGVSYDENG